MPTLVLERLRALGEAAAVPKKSLSGGVDTAATVVNAEEGTDSPKVRVAGAKPTTVQRPLCCRRCDGFDGAVEQTRLSRSLLRKLPLLDIPARISLFSRR